MKQVLVIAILATKTIEIFSATRVVTNRLSYDMTERQIYHKTLDSPYVVLL